MAQESQIRVAATVEKKLVKKLKLSATPEVRTDGLDPDKYMVEAGLAYKPIDYLALRTGYRFDLNERRTSIDSGHRYRFDVVGMWPMKRLEPNARIRYTHRFGEGRPIENRLRYLLALDYRIKKTQLTLSGLAEAFHVLDPNHLERMRYGASASYRFHKSKKLRQTVSAGYRFDYYLDQRLNVHIVDLGYKIAF